MYKKKEKIPHKINPIFTVKAADLSPVSILFDLDKSKDLSKKKKNWKYRQRVTYDSPVNIFVVFRIIRAANGNENALKKNLSESTEFRYDPSSFYCNPRPNYPIRTSHLQRWPTHGAKCIRFFIFTVHFA